MVLGVLEVPVVVELVELVELVVDYHIAENTIQYKTKQNNTTYR
jgi:hypothetical protein